MARLLRYGIDGVSVATVLLAAGFQVSALVFGWPSLCLLLIVPLARQVSIVQHNHAHVRIFHSRLLNGLFARLCSLCNGALPELYELHHVRNHHPFNQKFEGSEMDWSSLYAFRGTRFPDRPIGRAYYVLTFPLIAYSHCLIEVLRSPGSPIFRRFLVSAGLAAPTVAWLCWLDPWRFALFFVVPWTIIAFGLGYNNYSSHHGCSYRDAYDTAIDDLALPFRFLGYNQGYHLEHHLRPTLHWSLLPNFHEAIKEKIPPGNVRPNRLASVDSTPRQPQTD